jgi:hypothetical protein
MDYTFELSKSETSSPLSHPSLGMDDIYHSGIDSVVNFFRTEVKSFAADLQIAILMNKIFLQPHRAPKGWLKRVFLFPTSHLRSAFGTTRGSQAARLAFYIKQR